METVDALLDRWTVHCNCVRKRHTLGMTPVQACGIGMKNDWHSLVKEATKYETEREIAQMNGNQT